MVNLLCGDPSGRWYRTDDGIDQADGIGLIGLRWILKNDTFVNYVPGFAPIPTMPATRRSPFTALFLRIREEKRTKVRREGTRSGPSRRSGFDIFAAGLPRPRARADENSPGSQRRARSHCRSPRPRYFRGSGRGGAASLCPEESPRRGRRAGPLVICARQAPRDAELSWPYERPGATQANARRVQEVRPGRRQRPEPGARRQARPVRAA